MDVLPIEACMGFLKRNRVGVMALADEGRAYAIPLFYAFDGQRLYFQSHPGAKDHFLEHSRQGCFVVTEVKGDLDWRSVQAIGKVEKITLSDDAMKALDQMAKNPFPPEFGTEPSGEPKHSSKRMYLWMMTPDDLSGRSSHVKPRPT
jgi:nitroimidazol reductase NimA-like FMN-containing flavoprotein (pyridoxamine 5'-phosphate oxidase superfamily)